MPRPKPTYNDFLFAARNVLEALEEVGETWCCLVGGMAIKLWGVDHKVGDLDILVLSPRVSAGSLQEALRELQPNQFFLQRPKRPNATFMLLKYRIPGTHFKIKIDLLLSNEPNVEIPKGLHANHFLYQNELAVAPLYFVLYHKLLGWQKRLRAREGWKRKKAWAVDYPDIISLCALAHRTGIRPLSKSHMGKLYLDNFYDRAEEFVELYGDSARSSFRRLGFNL